jgi:hypothetical protein
VTSSLKNSRGSRELQPLATNDRSRVGIGQTHNNDLRAEGRAVPEDHQRPEQDAERELEQSTDAGYRDTGEQRAYEQAADRQGSSERPASAGGEGGTAEETGDER